MHLGDAVDDEAVAGRGVEQHQADCQQQHQRHQQRQQLVHQPPRPIALEPVARGLWRRVLARRGLVHQNAWPSDTATAIRLSPSRGLSGVPTSTRIGPNDE